MASPIWGAIRTEPTPPPLLGELGRSAADIESLAPRGVIGLATARRHPRTTGIEGVLFKFPVHMTGKLKNPPLPLP